MDVMTKCCRHCPTPHVDISPTTSSIRQFLADRTIPDPAAFTEQGALYSAYVEWCGTQGRPVHRNRFGRALSALGHGTFRTSAKRFRVGLSLTERPGLTVTFPT